MRAGSYASNITPLTEEGETKAQTVTKVIQKTN